MDSLRDRILRAICEGAPEFWPERDEAECMTDEVMKVIKYELLLIGAATDPTFMGFMSFEYFPEDGDGGTTQTSDNH